MKGISKDTDAAMKLVHPWFLCLGEIKRTKVLILYVLPNETKIGVIYVSLY
tara:strand:- start:488 stop:640 length:153 start_codon:yes stop_codon:yes gene_type:complete